MDIKTTTVAVFAFLIFGSWAPVARALGTDPFTLIFLMSCSAFTCGVVFGGFSQKQLFSDKYSLVVGLNLFLDLFLLVIAFRNLPISMVITLHFLGPVLISIFNFFKGTSRKNIKYLFYGITGFIGILIVNHQLFTSAQPYSSVGVIAALLSAITVAGNIVLQKKAMSRIQSSSYLDVCRVVTRYNFWICMFAGLAILIGGNFSIKPGTNIFSSDVLSALSAGILIQLIAMVFFNRAAKTFSAHQMGIFSFSEIIWSLLIGFFLYGEKLDLTQVFGFVVIVVTIFQSSKDEAIVSRKAGF